MNFQSFFQPAITRISLMPGNSPQVIDERTIRVNPGVRYEFSKNIYVESSYDYTAVDYLESNTSAHRNLLSIRLYIQYPIFE